MGASGEIIGNLCEKNSANVFIGLRNERTKQDLTLGVTPLHQPHAQRSSSRQPQIVQSHGKSDDVARVVRDQRKRVLDDGCGPNSWSRRRGRKPARAGSSTADRSMIPRRKCGDPIVHRVHRLAIRARRCRVLSSAMRANGTRQEGIEALAALLTLPSLADWRRGAACRASKAFAPSLNPDMRPR